MKLLRALTVLALAATSGAAAPDYLTGEQRAETAVAGLLGHGLRPAYRLAEGASDRLYALLSGRLGDVLLPGALAQNLNGVPKGGSYKTFEGALSRRQERFISQMRARYPTQGFDSLSGAQTREARLREWRGWAVEEQQGVVVAAFHDAMLSRYDLKRLGRESQAYAGDRRHWDAEFALSAGVLGGIFAYANGIQADASWGAFHAQVGMRAGYRIKDAVAAGGRARLGQAQLAYADVPVRLGFEWAVDGGRVVRDSVGLRYEARF